MCLSLYICWNGYQQSDVAVVCTDDLAGSYLPEIERAIVVSSANAHQVTSHCSDVGNLQLGIAVNAAATIEWNFVSQYRFHDNDGDFC